MIVILLMIAIVVEYLISLLSLPWKRQLPNNTTISYYHHGNMFTCNSSSDRNIPRSNGIQQTLLLSVTTSKEFKRVTKSNRWAGSREISHDPVGSSGSLRRSVILKSCRGDNLNGFPFCKNSSPIIQSYNGCRLLWELP